MTAWGTGGPGEPYLLPEQPLRSLDDYRTASWALTAIERAQDLGPNAVIEEVERAGLRGRGGAGFPTGRKWRSVGEQPGPVRYVVANGAEGEPGTFKDRTLLRRNPYQVIEGLMIAAFAVDATGAYLAVKASFTEELEALTRAATELQDAGYCRDCPLTLVRGPEEYLFGEEKALLEVIEGRPPLPRLLPPYEHGLFAGTQMGWEAGARVGGAGANPTVVNNVETLATVVPIIALGAEWFRRSGTEQSPGHLVATLVGDVRRPTVVEVPMGTPLRQVIEEGAEGTDQPVALVLPGVSSRPLTAGELDTPLSFEAFAALGSGLGSAGLIVADQTRCPIDIALEVSRFLSVESCGQCNPCKLGSLAITELLERLLGGTATTEDVAQLDRWLDTVTDASRCFLATQEQTVVRSLLVAAGHHLSEHVARWPCDATPFQLPALVDVADGQATFDERRRTKRPDWTYPADAPPG